MNTPKGFSDTIKQSIPLSLLQTALISAWAVTQILSGSIPGITSVKKNAKNFCGAVNMSSDISQESLDAIQGFKRGVILVNHPNKIMVDFPHILQELDENVTNNLRIATGRTVTPMYRTLLPKTETFCAEIIRNGDKERLEWDIDETIRKINEQSRVALLPYFWNLQAVHRRILRGVHPETPVLDITSNFPRNISYTEGWKFWENSMYGRLVKGKSYDTLQVDVSTQLKTAKQYDNQ